MDILKDTLSSIPFDLLVPCDDAEKIEQRDYMNAAKTFN